MVAQFYSFDIEYEPQLNTNWCWCACFSWVSKSLQLDTLFKEQHQFQHYYHNQVLNKVEGIVDKKAAKSQLNYLLDTSSDHIGKLIHETLKLDFNLIDLTENEVDKINTLKQLFHSQNITDHINSYYAPWIISTNYHMLLVSGFGHNSCGNYILISDPEIMQNEKFISFEVFIENYGNKIRKIWQLEYKLNPQCIPSKKDYKGFTQSKFHEAYIPKSTIENLKLI